MRHETKPALTVCPPPTGMAERVEDVKDTTKCRLPACSTLHDTLWDAMPCSISYNPADVFSCHASTTYASITCSATPAHTIHKSAA
jgi:hypothetical protein